MKTSSSVSLAVAAFALLAVGTASAQEKLRLPFAYTFSGPLIEFGERVWNEGILPGVEVVNKQGGIKGKQLEFYKVDTRFPELTGWLAEFRRICDDKSIPIAFGVGASKAVFAVYEETKRCGIPVFAPSAGAAWPFPDYAGWFFRYQPLADDDMPKLIKSYHAKNPIKKAAVSLTLDDDVGVNNAKISRKALQDIGAQIVADVSFKSKESNFSSQVSTVRAGGPDVILMHHQPGDAGTLLLQLRERGVEAQVLTDVIVGGADFWKLSQGKAIGAIGMSLYAIDDPRAGMQEWLKLWRQKTGKMNEGPDSFVTTYYDAVQVLAKLLNSAPELSREAIRDVFAKTKAIDTLSGTVGWNGPGEPIRAKPVFVRIGDNGTLKYWAY